MQFFFQFKGNVFQILLDLFGHIDTDIHRPEYEQLLLLKVKFFWGSFHCTVVVVFSYKKQKTCTMHLGKFRLSLVFRKI